MTLTRHSPGLANMNGFNLLGHIGNTPLVRLNHLCATSSAEVYVKLEKFNPGGSIKSRVALKMVAEAEALGILQPHSGQTLIEPTGGNTGLGLAVIGAIKGYKVILVIPDNYSKEKINLLEAHGAQIFLADSKSGNDCHVRKTEEILKDHSEYIWLNQLTNPANPRAHYEGTGEEIISELENIDCFVAGAGSGGTITGVSKRLREKCPKMKVVAVQPQGCNILEGTAILHSIQGFAIGMRPSIFDISVVDDVINVEYEQVRKLGLTIPGCEGLFVGISSCANIFAALQVARSMGKGKRIVTIAPDGGESYRKFYGLE